MRIQRPIQTRIYDDSTKMWGAWFAITRRMFNKCTQEWPVPNDVVVEANLQLDAGRLITSPCSEYFQYRLIDQQQKELF